MKSLIIPFHSFVDLITNSSSQVFITADEKTISAVRDMIDNLMKVAGSTQRSVDLFDIDIVDSYYGKTRAENDAAVAAGEADESEIRYLFGEEEYPAKTAIRVTPKINTPESAAAAKYLSKLTTMFSIEAYYS